MSRRVVYYGCIPKYEPETIAYMTAIGIADSSSSTIYTGVSGSDIWNGLDTQIVTLKTALGLTLKVNNLSTKFKFIYPRIGGSASTHRYNLVTALQDGTYNGGFTHDKTGSVGNGSTGYFQTGFLYTSAFTIANSSFGVFVKNAITENSIDLGAFTGGFADLAIASRWGSGNLLSRCGGSTGNYQNANTTSLGFKAVSRVNSSEYKVYENGSLLATNTDTVGLAPPVSTEIIEFALTTTGSISLYSNHKHTFSYGGVGFNGTEVNAVYTAFNNIDTLLGR